MTEEKITLAGIIPESETDPEEIISRLKQISYLLSKLGTNSASDHKSTCFFD